MRTSIKINDQYIQKILLGSTPVQRIYQSGSIVYEAGGSTPCFEVVDTISEASGNYVDVYVWDTEKWYKKNNLSQFEEYGIMPTVDSLTGVTTYTGKLVILSTDNHEYKWNGSSWVDLGECDVTVIHSPEYISRTSSYTGYVPLGDKFQENTVIEIDFQMTNDRGYAVIGDYWGNDNDDWRFFVNYNDGGYNGVNYDFDTTRIQTSVSNTKARFHLEIGNYYAKYYGASSNLITGARKTNFNRPNQMYLFHMDGPITQVNKDYGNVYMLKITQNGVLSKDFIPWTDMNGNYGFYDLLSNTVYPSTGNMTGSNNVTDIQIGEPIEDYPTKVAPANNVHYNTLAELELMECPWNGMQATVGPNYEHYVYRNNQWNKESMPCFEVVDTITNASGKYIDVYATDTQKWYKKNNLNQYEEYGLMPIVNNLDNITYYTGKLVILSTSNDSHEYKYNGTTWVDLGQAGSFKRVTWIDPPRSSSTRYNIPFKYYFNSGYKMRVLLYTSNISWSGDTGGFLNYNNKSPIEFNFHSEGYYFDSHYPTSTSSPTVNSSDYNKRVMKMDVFSGNKNKKFIFELWMDKVVVTRVSDGAIMTNMGGGYTSSVSGWYSGLYEPIYTVSNQNPAHVAYIQIYNSSNVKVNDIRPVLVGDDIQLYDSVIDAYYANTSANKVAYHVEDEGTLVPVEEYDTKTAPADNVHYDTLEELELMECPWYGMTATIGVNYVPYIYTNLGWIRKS